MSDLVERFVDVNDSPVRVWEKGSGDPLALVLGYGGAPRWPEFAERLSQRRRVYLLSLPGQHGSERGHDKLFTPLDWIVATIELIERAVPEQPVDLVTASAAGMLGAEVAALAPQLVRTLTLIGSLGLYDPQDPPTNPYAEAPFDRPKFLMEDQDKYKDAFAAPPGLSAADKMVYDIVHYRAEEAVCRLMWPFGDNKVYRRLSRVKAPTLLLWGEKDRCIPTSYADRFANLISGPSTIKIVDGAGHLVTHDNAEASAEAVLDFVQNSRAIAA